MGFMTDFHHGDLIEALVKADHFQACISFV